MTTDNEARRIASEWHGGQWSPLYAFSSTGTIQPGLTLEVKALRTHGSAYDDDKAFSDLGDLLAYVERHGERGPVAGWSDVSF